MLVVPAQRALHLGACKALEKYFSCRGSHVSIPVSGSYNRRSLISAGVGILFLYISILHVRVCFINAVLALTFFVYVFLKDCVLADRA
jgi:hypothetical protein